MPIFRKDPDKELAKKISQFAQKYNIDPEEATNCYNGFKEQANNKFLPKEITNALNNIATWISSGKSNNILDAAINKSFEVSNNGLTREEFFQSQRSMFDLVNLISGVTTKETGFIGASQEARMLVGGNFAGLTMGIAQQIAINPSQEAEQISKGFLATASSDLYANYRDKIESDGRGGEVTVEGARFKEQKIDDLMKNLSIAREIFGSVQDQNVGGLLTQESLGKNPHASILISNEDVIKLDQLVGSAQAYKASEKELSALDPEMAKEMLLEIKNSFKKFLDEKNQILNPQEHQRAAQRDSAKSDKEKGRDSALGESRSSTPSVAEESRSASPVASIDKSIDNIDNGIRRFAAERPTANLSKERSTIDISKSSEYEEKIEPIAGLAGKFTQREIDRQARRGDERIKI